MISRRSFTRALGKGWDERIWDVIGSCQRLTGEDSFPRGFDDFYLWLAIGKLRELGGIRVKDRFDGGDRVLP